jgi:hypothetical protein
MKLSPPIKVQVIILVFLTLLGFYFSFFQWFLVTDTIYTWLLYLAIFLSFIFGARVIYWQHNNNYSRLLFKKLDPLNKIRDRIIFSLMTIAGFAMAFSLALPFGIPVSLHTLSTSPSEIKITIDSKHPGTRRSIRCVKINGYTLLNGHFCHVPITIWNKLKEGDTLIAKGERSIFGFYAHTLTLVNDAFKQDAEKRRTP